MSNLPRISVALCTYNGASFLRDQLASIAAQTRLPDELVVCDDRSEDGTIDIIDDLRLKVQIPVRLSINAERLGSTRNFERAIGLCAGDIIALADQDDIWLPEKLARVEAAFLDVPKAGAVFSDAEIVDAHGQPLGERLWHVVGFDRPQQHALRAGRTLQVLLKHNVVTGATLAFRASHRALVLPIPDNWVHDGWIALLIAATTELEMLPEPLVKYRRHAGQQLGAMKRGLLKRWQWAQATSAENYLSVAAQYEAARARLALLPAAHIRAEALHMLDEKTRHFHRRASLPHAKIARLSPILSELVARQYHRYSNGWTSAIKDFWF